MELEIVLRSAVARRPGNCGAIAGCDAARLDLGNDNWYVPVQQLHTQYELHSRSPCV